MLESTILYKKCPQLILLLITVDYIEYELTMFYPQDGGKISWHRYRTKLRHCHHIYATRLG